MPFTFKSAQKAVAVFIFIGISLFFTTIILIARGSDVFTLKNNYYTYLSEGYGIKPGTLIYYKGIKIGKVKSVKLEKTTDRIKIEFDINRDFSDLIKSDTVLKVTGSLLGGATISITSSLDENAKVLPKGSMVYSSDMDEGREIINKLVLKEKGKKDDLTEKAKQVMDMVMDLRPEIKSTLLNVKYITSDIRSIVAGLKGSDKTLVSDKLLSIIDNLLATSANIKNLLNTIQSTDHSIGALIKDNKTLYKKIDSIIDSIDKSLKSLNKITTGLENTPYDIKQIMILLRENLIELRNVLKSLPLGSKDSKEEMKIINSGGRK